MNLKILIQPIIILILLVVIFKQRNCSRSNVIYKTKLTKQFDTIYKPLEIKFKTITKYKNIKGDIVYFFGKVDTLQITKFEKSTDTVKTNMFTEAIKIRQYKQQFNDSLADVSIFAETKGELLKLAPTITIKSRLPEKKTVFALYTGGGLYLNKNFDLGYKLDVKFQNKKGDLIGGSYDPINKVIFAEYNFRILNIKK